MSRGRNKNLQNKTKKELVEEKSTSEEINTETPEQTEAPEQTKEVEVKKEKSVIKKQSQGKCVSCHASVYDNICSGCGRKF